MRSVALATALAAFSVEVFALPAFADEMVVPLAQSGEWMTSAHKASITARPDMCLTFSLNSGVAFRADANGDQIRVVDPKWSLPADVEGNVTISVGSWKGTFKIDDNTDTMVNAEIEKDDIIAMFVAMDTNASMSVTVGKAKPFVVSLVGSTKSTNAFRTCAGLKSNSPTPGSNPFQ
jgi:hypothetical protein